MILKPLLTMDRGAELLPSLAFDLCGDLGMPILLGDM